MTSVTDYFDQIQIINMVRRTDRRRETEQEFARHGWTINPPKIGFFDAVTPQEAAGFPNPGVRGCFLSHLGILQAALHSQKRHVWVLEDDVAFCKNMATWGATAVDALEPLDWDIAYLGHALDDVAGPPRWLAVEQPMLLAHCYAINGKTLGRLVPFLEAILQRPAGHPDGGPMHYDGALNTFIQHHPEVRAWYFSKNLAYQRPSKTDLHQASVLDRHWALRPFAGIYRAIKRLYLQWTR